MKFDQQKYVDIFTEPLLECFSYMPKFGNTQNKNGVSLNDFMKLYGNDPFYSKIGLNSPFMYAASTQGFRWYDFNLSPNRNRV